MAADRFSRDFYANDAQEGARVRSGGWRRSSTPHARPATVAIFPFKRLVDIAFSALALTMLSPFLAFIGLLVRLDSQGPVLFRQTRAGRGGAPFTILKFRTMRASFGGMSPAGDVPVAPAFGARLGQIQVSASTPNITRVGRWLRATSLDELPQLVNVLQGDMSLVGPRPHLAELDRLFHPLLPQIARRYAVSPGMTGLAQVNGRRGPTPDVSAMAARLNDDLAYIQNASIGLDLRILALTPMRMLASSARATQHTCEHGHASALPIRPRARYTGERCRASGNWGEGRRRRLDNHWFFPEARKGAFWRQPAGSNGGRAL